MTSARARKTPRHRRKGFCGDDVAGVDEELGDQVECLLAPGSDDDVVRIGADDTVIVITR